MECDLVVAVAQATVDGHTLFGQNCSRPALPGQVLQRRSGREFAPGEKVLTQYLEVPQVRQTCTVLGSRPEGAWGYDCGVNEYQVAVGCALLPPSPCAPGAGLVGPDLVRLTLERSHSARQGVEVLTDLIEAHGQRSAGEGEEHAFLVADTREAFVVETAGRHWVYQEVRQARALGNVRVVRQDWDRIAQGLAAHASASGWWTDDGSKLDFAGVLGEPAVSPAAALRRWGRATLLLEQQSGHIDAAFVRGLLSDHYEGTSDEIHPLSSHEGPVSLCQHGTGLGGRVTVASFVADLAADPARLPIAWCALGPPCSTLYFPLFLEGELPEAFTCDRPELSPTSVWSRVQRLRAGYRGRPKQWDLARDSFARLQARFDQEADEFAVEGAALRQHGDLGNLQRLAGIFMQHNLERFEEVAASLTGSPPARARVRHWAVTDALVSAQ